jgi:hypothetical protein
MTAWRGDMADVAEICGDAVARELCEKLPGILFYVPKRIRDKGQIGLLSDAIANTLVSNFGGDTLYIPSKRKTFYETFEAVEALVDKGLTTQQIALKLGVTQAYIFQVRRKAGAPKIANKPDPRQLPLFE